VWSKYPVLEHAVANFGASGSLVAQGTDTIHLAVESAVEAKLDWYVHTSASYHVSIDANGAALITAKIVVQNTAPKNCRPHYVCGPDNHNSHVRGQYVARLDLWFPRGAIVDNGIAESGLTLARATVNVLPGHRQTLLIEAFVRHAVHNGAYSLQFIPQSTLNAQHLALAFSAPNWSVSGPSTASWVGHGTTAFHWTLSH